MTTSRFTSEEKSDQTFRIIHDALKPRSIFTNRLQILWNNSCNGPKQHTNQWESWEISTFFLSYCRLHLMSKTVWWAVSSCELKEILLVRLRTKSTKLWSWIWTRFCLAMRNAFFFPRNACFHKRVSTPDTDLCRQLGLIPIERTHSFRGSSTHRQKKTRHMAMILDSILTEAKQIVQRHKRRLQTP